MPISSVDRVKPITLSLSAVNQANIVTIYQNSNLTVGDELMTGYTIISFNCFIKNLKAFAQIKSVAEAPLPDFLVEDSETDKLYKTLDIEWKSPRKQLSLYVSSNNQGWFKVGSLSLLNPAGYPFRIYNLMDLFTDNLALELGESSKVGISVDEVGFGLLAANDTVTIHGSYVEEIFLQSIDPIQPVIVNITNTGISASTPTVIPASLDYSFGDSSLISDVFLVGDSSTGTSTSTPTTLDYSFSDSSLINDVFLVGNSFGD